MEDVFMKNISFGNRILLLILLLLLMSVSSTVYLMHIIKTTETSLLQSQQEKLEKVALFFDQSMPEGFGAIIRQGAHSVDRDQMIQNTGQMINTKIAEIKNNYPEVHLGIYVNQLDVFYDGTLRFGENFSLRRKNAFDEVISSQKPLIQDLGPEKGGVVEIYRPFIRNDRLEGVIRSAIYLADTNYYDQRKEIENTVYVIIGLVIVTGTGGSMILFRQFVSHVHNIKAGVKRLEDDLGNTLAAAPGELGEIVSAINGLAIKIAHLNLYNEKMLASIDDAIIVVDNGGRVVIDNTMAEKMFNIQEKAKGAHFNEILPGESPFGLLLQDTLGGSRSYRDLQVDWVSGGHVSHILVSTSTLADHGGNIIGAVLSCRDITERIKLEEKMRLQERLASLGKLVTGVAHEIRNPLTSISCYIQHWQNQNKPNPRALATMYREVARLDSIVDQLLYFAKPAEAKFSFNDINIILDNMLAFFNELHQGRYNLVKNLPAGLPKVWIDTEQIERVVANIMFNALQALPEEGTVIVSTAYLSGEDMVEVSIADNGCGIPQENLVHLFDPFYSTRPKGTGLGLAIAHEIIKAHGGHIEVESEVGRGTRFAFYLRTKEDV
jgi:two-component system sensor histidine kinase AtoS